MLCEIDEYNRETLTKIGGQQDGFIIKEINTGLKLFTKTSRVNQFNKNYLDPRELYV